MDFITNFSFFGLTFASTPSIAGSQFGECFEGGKALNILKI